MGSPVDWEARFKAFAREVFKAYADDLRDEGFKRVNEMHGRFLEEFDADRDLLVASDCCCIVNGQLMVNLGDTMAWACADGEDIPPECVAEVADLFRSWGHKGLIYWASKRRGWERSAFKDINRFIDFVRREEEWKVKEPSSSKRAYTDIPAEESPRG